MLKDYLTSKNISFEEKLVDVDSSSRDTMLSLSGGYMGVPFTHIVKDTSEEVSVIGFDKNKFDSILG